MRSLGPVLGKFFSTLTLEPVLFIYNAGLILVTGPQIDTDFQYKKICEVELGLSVETCANLTAFPDLNEEVTDRVNHFQMYQEWIKNVPSVAFSLIMGAFADNFGPKIVFALPIFGHLLDTVIAIVNYAFYRSLPLEMLYLQNMYWLFGGLPVYYLGMYPYGSLITEPKDRPARLARFDGTEILAQMAFSPLGGIVYQYGGYYACQGIRMVTTVLALLYLFFFVKNVKEHKTTNTNQDLERRSKQPGVASTLFTSTWQMLKSLFRRRNKNLRMLVILQIFELHHSNSRSVRFARRTVLM